MRPSLPNESLEISLPYKEKLAFHAKRLASVPQVECPLKHYFAPHVYVREIFMPAGSIVIGKIHKTEHFNIIQKGRVTLANEDGSTKTLEGPCTFISKAGVQKALYIHEDTVWSTVHITENRDLESLEAELIEPSEDLGFDRSLERTQILEAASVEPIKEIPDAEYFNAVFSQVYA